MLYELDIARVVTGLLCPKNVFFGCKSTDFAVDTTLQTDIVLSMLAVTRVFESAKAAVEI